MTSRSPNAAKRLIGMVRAPWATLQAAIATPRWLDLAVLIVVVAGILNAGFLMTRVGRLAALDQQVRQLESFGVDVTDARYEELKQLVPYRPAISAAVVVVGWPLAWLGIAALIHMLGRRTSHHGVTYAQVLAVVVHASAILAVRALIEAPVNYARESLGGATSLRAVLPAFSESTFPARLLGAIDIFIVWWVVLLAMGLALLYRGRTVTIARWLFGAYAAAAVALAVAQALRGGI